MSIESKKKAVENVEFIKCTFDCVGGWKDEKTMEKAFKREIRFQHVFL